MKKFKKVICILTAAILLVTALSGCQQNAAYEVPTTITVDGNPVEVDYVLKVDGEEVPLDLYRYFFLTTKYNMDQGDENYWKTNPDQVETLKENTLSSIKSYFAVNTLAEDNGVSFSEDDSTLVSSQIEQVVTSKFNGKKEDFLAALEEAYMNEALYNKITENNLFLQKVLSELMDTSTGKYLFTEEEMWEILSNDYIRASHILLQTTDVTDVNAVKQKAEEALKKAQDGEDFDKLVEEYGEDPGMKDNADGYYFTEGMMVEEFYTAAKALKENEISGLVESSYGYHIIKRLPLDKDYIDKNIDTLIASHRKLKIQNEYTKDAEALHIDFGPQYDQINVDTLR